MLRYITAGDRLLIQAVPGIWGALGRRVKRRGFAAQAAVSTAWRFVLDRGRSADMHRVRGVQPDPGMQTMLVVVVGEEHAAERAGVLHGPERARKAGQYFSVLNCASLYGLSLLTFGWECDLRIARSGSSADTVMDVIEVPRSAWMACGAVPLLRRTASVMKSFASSPSSVA
jgi:hypothetical protein